MTVNSDILPISHTAFHLLWKGDMHIQTGLVSEANFWCLRTKWQ